MAASPPTCTLVATFKAPLIATSASFSALNPSSIARSISAPISPCALTFVVTVISFFLIVPAPSWKYRVGLGVADDAADGVLQALSDGGRQPATERNLVRLRGQLRYPRDGESRDVHAELTGRRLDLDSFKGRGGGRPSILDLPQCLLVCGHPRIR